MVKQISILSTTLLVAGSATALALGNSGGVRANPVIYRLARGDSARIPSLGWTCIVAKTPQSGSGTALLCSTDRKPIRSVWISQNRVFVSVGHRPAPTARGYAFHY